MENIVFEGFGSKIIERDKKYYVRYDAGWINVVYSEVEITKEEVEKFKLSEKDAYEVIVNAQNKLQTGKSLITIKFKP